MTDERASRGTAEPERLSPALRLFAAAFFVYELLWVAGAFSTRYFFILDESHRAVSLGLLVVLTFWLTAHRRGGLRWHDVALMIGGAAGCFYVAPTSTIVELQMAAPVPRPAELVLAVVTIAALLEGTRRVAGNVLPALLLAFVGYALWADRFPGVLYGRAHTLPRVLGELYLSVHGIFGDVMGLWTRILVVFVVFGAFLQVSGAGRFFIDLALSVAGHRPGGPAKVAVIASGLFGTISGSAAADVATTGVVTIPMMKAAGYRPAFAGAVEAVASTGGILMPPLMGMTAFLVAEFLDVPYLEVAKAALVPAVLYYLTLYVLVDLEARRTGLRGIAPFRAEAAPISWRRGAVFLVPIAVLVFYLAVRRTPPGPSALYALGALFVATAFDRETRMTPRRLLDGFEAAARTALVVAIVCGSVGILITSLVITGVTLRLAVLLVEISAGHLALLLALAGIASLVLGTGVPAIASYVLLATTVAPAIVELGVPPLAAHLFVLYWGISHVITPPVGGALYIASSFSGVDIWRQGYAAIKLGIGLFFLPFVFCYHPEILMMGEPAAVLVQTLLAAAAMGAVAASLIGYLGRPLGLAERVGLAGLAVALVVQSVASILLVAAGLAAAALLRRAASKAPAR